MNEVPRFESRKGLGSRQGWDIRLGDEEDVDGIRALALAEGLCNIDDVLGSNNDDMTWHIIESSVHEGMMGFVATRVKGSVAKVEALAADGNNLDITLALIACAENTAASSRATECQVPSAMAQSLGYQAPKVDASGLWTKTFQGVEKSGATAREREWPGAGPLPFVSDEPSLPPPPPLPLTSQEESRQASVPELSINDLSAQLELAASIKSITNDLFQDIDKAAENLNDTTAATEASESSLEDLMGSLLKTLKTDQGRLDFNRLAQAQQDQANERLAPRAFVPRPQPTSHEVTPTSATTTTIGDARAFAQLLASDVALQSAVRKQHGIISSPPNVA